MPYYENLTLYYKRSCPYCHKVLRFMEENSINLDLRETTEPGNQQDLVAIGGRKQVPCLIIEGRAMYESDDIVSYLQELIA